LIGPGKNLEIRFRKHLKDLPERRTVRRISFPAITDQRRNHFSVAMGKNWQLPATNPPNDIELRF
jgi:hypothetical protein